MRTMSGLSRAFNIALRGFKSSPGVSTSFLSKCFPHAKNAQQTCGHNASSVRSQSFVVFNGLRNSCFHPQSNFNSLNFIKFSELVPTPLRACRTRPFTSLSFRTPVLSVKPQTFGPRASRTYQVSSYRQSNIDPESVVYGLLALNVGVFCAWRVPDLQVFMRKNFMTSYNHLAYGNFHTLLTHAVSHVDFFHILANMITFYFYAPELAMVIGGIRVCIL